MLIYHLVTWLVPHTGQSCASGARLSKSDRDKDTDGASDHQKKNTRDTRSVLTFQSRSVQPATQTLERRLEFPATAPQLIHSEPSAADG